MILAALAWLALSPAAAQPALVVATTTAHLGVAVPIRVDTTLQPDLARSTTETYAVAAERKEGALELKVLPLAVGKLPVTIWWSDGSRSALELDVAEPDLPADAEVADIKTPMRARPALWPWLLGAAALWALWRWRKSRPASLPSAAAAAPPDPRPAETIALEALAALESSGLWSEGRHKEFYVRFTDIMRAYLEKKLDLPARKLTSSELTRRLRESALDRGALQLVRDVLHRADLVKFAKSVPAAGQDALDLDAARKIVALTASPELAVGPKEGAP